MKKSVFVVGVVWMVVTSLYGQSDIEKKIKEQMWGNPPASFKNTDVPDKWKKESAVALALHREYILDFTTKVTGLTSINRFYIETLNYHFRIKLLDKAAVKDYSELAFDSKNIKTNLFGKASAYRVVGIKVIKPNGQEKEVDLSQAVKTDVTSTRELKIPIPNLEEGDIIDYFIAIRDESATAPDFGDEYMLEFKYPIVSNTVTFTMPHQYHLHYTAYNDELSFKREKKDKDVTYTLTDQMREKAPDLVWNYPLQSAPHFRYRVIDQELRPKVEQEARNLLMKFSYNPSNIGHMTDFINGNFKKTKDSNLIFNEIYFLLRNPIYMKAYYKTELGNPLGAPLSTNQFFLLLDKVLAKYKISHELVIAPTRDAAPWDRLINMSSCEFFMRVGSNPPVYVTRPHPFSIPNDIPYIFEGSEAVSVVEKKTLAASDHTANSTATTLQVNFNPEDEKIHIARQVHVKGNNKLSHQYLIFTNYDYLQAYDLPKYQVQSSTLIKGILKEYNKEKTKYSQRLTQDYNERDERIKKSLEADLDAKVVEYKNLKIKNIGMWDTAPDTEYEDEFIIENLTRKAGPNILVDIGKLIEKQTEISEEQKNRTRDIHMPYPRSFMHTISFTVPAGYKLEGIESLNKRVQNETGGFESFAKLNGNVLTITTHKFYSKYTYPASDWNQLVAFLTAAVDFYSAKVLLKKT